MVVFVSKRCYRGSQGERLTEMRSNLPLLLWYYGKNYELSGEKIFMIVIVL